MNNVKKVGKASLIKEFFGMDARTAVEEYKKLSELDRVQLASAIARQKGLTPEECEFEFVAY